MTPMIEILKQAPRLHIEAAKQTRDVNEAYLMVHNAIADAVSQNAIELKANKARSTMLGKAAKCDLH